MFTEYGGKKWSFLETNEKRMLVIITINACALLLTVSSVDRTFALNFSNYSSEKYQMAFQYPSNWEIKEKTGRFDESPEITLSATVGVTLITISYAPDSPPLHSPDTFSTLVNEVFKRYSGDDFNREYKTIENPTFTTIDGKQTGTFVFTSKEKYDVDAIAFGDQVWMVNNLNHGYVISFLANTDSFDSPENIQIRDQFIKSIKFLG
jgi:hypothetical protein